MMIFAHGAIISAVIPRTEHVSPERSYAAVVAGKVRNPTLILSKDIGGRIERTVEQEKADSRREGGRWTLVNASKKGRRPQHSKVMMINARGAIGEAVPRTFTPVNKERVLAFESNHEQNNEHVSPSSSPLAKIDRSYAAVVANKTYVTPVLSKDFVGTHILTPLQQECATVFRNSLKNANEVMERDVAPMVGSGCAIAVNKVSRDLCKIRSPVDVDEETATINGEEVDVEQNWALRPVRGTPANSAIVAAAAAMNDIGSANRFNSDDGDLAHVRRGVRSDEKNEEVGSKDNEESNDCLRNASMWVAVPENYMDDDASDDYSDTTLCVGNINMGDVLSIVGREIREDGDDDNLTPEKGKAVEGDVPGDKNPILPLKKTKYSSKAFIYKDSEGKGFVENANKIHKTIEERRHTTKDCVISSSGSGLVFEEVTGWALAPNRDDTLASNSKSTHHLTAQTLCKFMWHKWFTFCIYIMCLVTYYAGYLTLNGDKKRFTALINTFIGRTGARISLYLFEAYECFAKSFHANLKAINHTITNVLSAVSHLPVPYNMMPVTFERRRVFKRSSTTNILAVVLISMVSSTIIIGGQARQVSLQFWFRLVLLSLYQDMHPHSGYASSFIIVQLNPG